MQQLCVAVVGGGVSGSSCAWRLAQSGHTIELFDLGSRFPGGRASTRRIPGSDGAESMQFDHGAQFLTSSDPRTQRLIDELKAAGKLSEWKPQLAEVNTCNGAVALKEAGQVTGGFFGALSAGPLYVGHPTMDAICGHLSSHSAIKLRLGTKVAGATFDAGSRKWQLHGHSSRPGSTGPANETALGEFDALVCADALCAKPGTPGFVAARGQAAAAALKGFQQAVAGLPRTTLFSLLLGYDQQGNAGPKLPFDAASFSPPESSSLAWLAKNSSKPGRPSDGLQCWVALSSESCAKELLGAEAGSQVLPAQDAAYLAERAGRLLEGARRDLGKAGLTLPDPVTMQLHRWGSAYTSVPLGVPCIVDAGTAFVAAGDFCLGPGIESAMLSGLAAADAVDAHAAAKAP